MTYRPLQPEDLPEPHELYGEGQTTCPYCFNPLWIVTECAVLRDERGEVRYVVTETCEDCETEIH